MKHLKQTKSFYIPKTVVYEAFKRVRANAGAAGVDKQSLKDFEQNLSGNLYKLWNRMSSGSYFPPPVKRKDIPKDDKGGTRPLGIPTVSDRIAKWWLRFSSSRNWSGFFILIHMDTAPGNRHMMQLM